MASKELEWGMEEVVLKQKKPSREERKNQQIMKLFGKLENNNTKHEVKPRPTHFSHEKASKPHRKVKVLSAQRQVDCDRVPASVNSHDLESSSTSEPPLLRKPSNVINPLYILNSHEDLYSHILEYGLAERAKYIETITTDKLDLDNLPGEALTMLPQDVLSRTNQAFKKIQNKFTELKPKLSRPTSKEHKQFSSHYLNLQFLLG